MRLGLRGELSELAAGGHSGDGAYFSIADVLELVAPMHKDGKDGDAHALINACEQAEGSGDVVLPEMNADTLHLSLFDRDSAWGGPPAGIWPLAATAAVRCEHTIRLLQVREWDVVNGDSLLGGVPVLYPDDEERGNHG